MGLMEASLLTMGTVLSAADSIRQGNQQAAQARYQADMATNNANIARQNAADAVTAGKAEEQRQRITNSQKIGSMRAQMGASGVDSGMGSALDGSAALSMMGEADALNVRDEWLRNQNSYLQKANDFGNQASLYENSARNNKANGTWKGSESLLSGARSVANRWVSLI
ncbi:hypothetical protein [Insolitispirillum peregrinum]|uniref:Uncharacterized protein n=1 Tax=Insolitispirillum peregrinum TaxID=80876 RepID=A0A1N7LGH6_9PROT|nr:hypothetical protein [Insolitispirillum peregrinum]SIS72932.1 hypothetical protein SAMN05421779_103315 [Insolitispirillum peregrinum]